MRRFVAVLLGIIFVPVLVFALLFYRVNGTVASPDFYSRQLQQADVYSYVYSDILPAAVDSSPDLKPWKATVIKVARDTTPPEWLQAQAEQFIGATVPYLVSDTASFRVVVPLKDRVRAAGTSLKSALSQSDVQSQVYSLAFQSAMGQIGSISSVLPLLVPVNTADIIAQVMPPEWLAGKLGAVIDEAVPYLTGDEEHFTVTVSLADRADALQAVVTDILKQPQAYDYVSKNLMVQAIRGSLSKLPIPASLTITDADITTLVAQAFPLDWYQAQVPNIVGQMFTYMRSTRPTMDITLSVADRKTALVAAGVKLISQKLGTDVSAFAPLLTPLVPDQYTFSDPPLTASVAGFKDLLQKGFTYTDQDLAKSIGTATLQTARQVVSTGFVFTDKDLRSAMGSGNVDTVRSYAGTFRSARFYVWIMPLLLLAAIGFLGSRRLGSRLARAGVALAVAALAALIVFGPVFSGVVQPAINSALTRTAPSDVLNAVVSAKLTLIVQNSLASFVSGLRVESVVLLVVGLAAAAGGILLHVRRKPAECEREPPRSP